MKNDYKTDNLLFSIFNRYQNFRNNIFYYNE